MRTGWAMKLLPAILAAAVVLASSANNGAAAAAAAAAAAGPAAAPPPSLRLPATLFRRLRSSNKLDGGAPGSTELAAHPVTNATYAVGLSATGFLLPFMLGAVEVLGEVGVLVPGETPVAGSSGGALVALAACARAPPDAVHAALEGLAARCRSTACAFTQDAAVREAIAAVLAAAPGGDGGGGGNGGGGGDGAGPRPPATDAEIVSRCRGKAFAAMSVAFGGAAGFEPGGNATRRRADDDPRGDAAEEGGGFFRRCASSTARGGGGGAGAAARLLRLLPPPAACAVASAARAVAGWARAPARLARALSSAGPGLLLSQQAYPPSWRPGLWLVGDWASRAELVDGVAASCFFPLLSSPWRAWASLRGRTRLVDGVFAAPLPLPPTNDDDGSGAAAGRRRRPAPRPVRVSAVPLGMAAAPFSRPVREAEIAPNLRVKSAGFSAAAWERYLVLVPPPAEREAMRDLGRREAFAWWAEEVAALALADAGAGTAGGGAAVAAS